MRQKNLALSLLGAVWVLILPIHVTAAAELSARDAKIAKGAFKALDAHEWKRAERLAQYTKNPIPIKIIRWRNIVRPATYLSFHEISRFIKDHPSWPRQNRLRRRAEEAMRNSLPAPEVIRWFKKYTPVSTDGQVQLAQAMLAMGKTDKAHEMLRYIWQNGNFGGKKKERWFYKKFRKVFSSDANVKRMDRLLWQGRYWPARRMLWRVDKDYRSLGFARLQLRFRRGNVDKAIERVPAHLKGNLGLAYERLRWRRKKQKYQSAVELLDAISKRMPKSMPYPEKWWGERSILARRSLSKGFISQAYRMANGGEHKKGSKYAETEWLAGWIALRFIKDYKAAVNHFTQMHARVKYPISLARAAYWSGRAFEAMSKKKKALEWYRKAAKYPTKYYGQLALVKLPKKERKLTIPPEPKISKQTIHKYAKNDMVRAVRVLIELGRKDHIKPFIMSLYRSTDSPQWRAMTAALARIYDRPDIAIRVAKDSLRKDGRVLLDSGYPSLNPPPPIRHGNNWSLEVPLVLSVIRQESAFNPTAQSHAGARGLMQLMPATASNVAKQIRLAYSKGRLTSDPNYNLKLGQTYLIGLLKQFKGSYVLALCAYNAGPHRAKKWIKINGDPRHSDVDVIDWVEKIPFTETRNYVQRVMENLQVYRFRLAKTPVQAELEKDLSR
jgi:soluble lytic murein transglycosylase